MEKKYMLQVNRSLLNNDFEALIQNGSPDKLAAQVILRRLGRTKAMEWQQDGLISPTPWAQAWGNMMFNHARNRPIHIFGDYDCDGLASTTMLYKAMLPYSPEVKVYLPSREDGYGAKVQVVEEIYRQQPESVILFVDNGTHILDTLAAIRKSGGQVFVIDHHAPKPVWHAAERLMELSDWVLNPHTAPPDIKETLFGVPAAALTFWATMDFAQNSIYERALLAALGIIGDVGHARNMSNHSILKFILKADDTSPLFWRAARKTIAALTPEPFSIAMKFLPLLNAAGRMGKTMDAFTYLIENDNNKVYRHLINLQWLEKQVADLRARWSAQMLETAKVDRNRAIFYHPGIPIGIVSVLAGQLLYSSQCDLAIVMSKNKHGAIVGSIRTKSGFNALNFIENVAEAMNIDAIEYGGHDRAAGFSIVESDIDRLVDVMCNTSDISKQAAPESLNNWLAPNSVDENENVADEGEAEKSQQDDVVRTWRVDAILAPEEWLLIHKTNYNFIGPFIPGDDSWQFPRVLLTGVAKWDIQGDMIVWSNDAKTKFTATMTHSGFYVSERARDTSPEDRAVLLIATPGQKFAMGIFSMKNDIVQDKSRTPKLNINAQPSHFANSKSL